jgi:hypothetical protein
MINQSISRILLLQTCPLLRLGLQHSILTASKAALYRTKAILALHTNASLSARLARYNSHMATARFLDTKSASGNNLEWPKYPPPASSQDRGGLV